MKNKKERRRRNKLKLKIKVKRKKARILKSIYTLTTLMTHSSRNYVNFHFNLVADEIEEHEDFLKAQQEE